MKSRPMLTLDTASTDMSVCGFTLPTQTSNAPGTQNTAASDNSGHKTKGLSGGSIAGIVVGSVIGGLLVRLSSCSG